MDSLVEQVVKRERSPRYYLNIVLIILAAVAVPGTFMVLGKLLSRYYLALIGVFLLLFAIYLAWYFITSQKIEYEYAILGSTLRIDKIIAKRRRKKVIKFDVKDIDGFFRYSDEKMSKVRYDKVYEVGARSYDESNYVATLTLDGGKKVAVVFCPKEELLTAMRPYFNHEVSRELYLEKVL